MCHKLKIMKIEKSKLVFLMCIGLLTASLCATQVLAQTTQMLRGKIVDEVSKSPLIGATVQVLVEPAVGAVTDTEGNYSIANVPLGRQTFRLFVTRPRPGSARLSCLKPGGSHPG